MTYDLVVVSARDKAKMQSIASALARSETDERGSESDRARILEHINADRLRQGLEPLIDRAPEEGLLDRAKSLGMARIDR